MPLNDLITHDKNYTADGALLKEGLEVWCIDYPIAQSWIIQHNDKATGTWLVCKGAQHRDACYSLIFARKDMAIIARIDLLKRKIWEVYKAEINPRKEEVRQLVELSRETDND